MINTVLKDQIDSDITNKVLAKSITPKVLGDDMKAIVDFAYKVVKTTIPVAQVLTLFDTPVTVLDSSEDGLVRYPTLVHIVRNEGNAYTLAASSFSLISDSGTAVSGNLNPNPLTGTSIGYFSSAMNVVLNNSGVSKNDGFKLRANTGNPSGGTGDLDVYVTYVEITL